MDKYDITNLILETKHTKVYRGRKKLTLDFFVVKSVSLTQKERAINEGRTLHELKHDRILRFKEWYLTRKNIWMVLEFCLGGDLRTVLKQDLCLPEDSVRSLGMDLVAALLYMHSRGFLHNDLKPSNVLLDEQGRVKLAGLGLARTFADCQANPQVRQQGSPCYMAPELFWEQPLYSTAADVWALGCLLYECAAGHAPFLSTSFQELSAAVLQASPSPIPNASLELQALVDGMLCKDPVRRLSWQQVTGHPFWLQPLPCLQTPPQPELEALLAQQAQQAKAGAQGDARLLRMSVAASVNLQGTAGPPGGAKANGKDVLLGDADAELDFREAGARSRQHTAAEASELIPASYHQPTGLEGGPQQAPARQLPPMHQSEAVRAAAAAVLDAVACEPARPIVRNRRIERAEPPAWDAAGLPFNCMESEEVLEDGELGPGFLEHLQCISHALSVPHQAKDKANICAYLEALCIEAAAAQLAWDTRLPHQLAGLLGSARSGLLRAHAAACLGLLIRHATYIPPSQAGLVKALADAFTSEGGVNTRRHLAAALGELLFYIASQAGQDWAFPVAALPGYLDALGAAEDDPVVQHYVCQAADNLLTRQGPWTPVLAVSSTANSLLSCASSSQAVSLQEGALSCLGRLMDAAPPLIMHVHSVLTEQHGGGGLPFFVSGMSSCMGAARVRMGFATLLGLLATQAPALAAFEAAQGQHSALMEALGSLMEPGQAAQAERALGTLGLLLQKPALCAAACSSLLPEAVAAFEGQQQDAEAEQPQAAAFLVEVLYAVVQTSVQQACSQVVAGLRAQVTAVGDLPSLAQTSAAAAVQTGMQLLHAVAASQRWRRWLLCTKLCSEVEGVLKGQAESEARVSLQAQATLQQLVVLLAGLAETRPDQDATLRALFCVATVLAPLAYPATERTLAGAAPAAEAAQLTQPCQQVLEQQAIPAAVACLRRPAMAGPALKLLAAVLLQQPSLADALARQGVADQCFLFLAPGHPCNSVHNLAVCAAMVAQAAVGPSLLAAYDVPRRAADVLAAGAEDRVHAIWHAALVLVAALLVAEHAGPPGSTGVLPAMAPQAPTLLFLAAVAQDSEDKLLAVQSLAVLLELDPSAGLFHLLQPGSTAPLGDVWVACRADADAVQRLLACLTQALMGPHPGLGSQGELRQLQTNAARLRAKCSNCTGIVDSINRLETALTQIRLSELRT